MAYQLATAYIQIVPTTEGIKSNIEKELGSEIKGASDSSGKSFASGFLKAAGATIATGAAAIGAAATAVWKTANEVAAKGDAIDKSSQQIGVSAEQYQALAFAAEHCGFSVSQFTLAARNLENTKFDGNIYDAMNAIMALDDESKRTQKAVELFGERSAQAMKPFLNGSQSMEDFKDQLADIGGLMSNESVSASATFEDSLTDLMTAFGGLKANLTADFLPTITEVMDGLTMLINGDEGGLSKIKEGINKFLSGIQEMLPGFMDVAVELINTFVQMIVDNLPQIIEMGVNIILKLIVGILEALPDLLAKVPEIIGTILEGLSNAFPDMVDAGVNLVKGLWEGIKNAKDWLFEKITGWVGNVTDFLKDLFGIASPSKVMRDEVGRYLPMGIAKGIEENAFMVDNAMADLMGNTTANATADVMANVRMNSLGGSLGNGENLKDIIKEALIDSDLKVELDGREMGRLVLSYD